jgi:hypothetical protein
LRLPLGQAIKLGAARAGHCFTSTSISFGSTPAIKPKFRSRCRSGIPAKIAYVAIRQSFADRGVTPAHRHRAYKCAALRAASRVSGAITIGNSPSTRSQRVNRSGLSAPWRTSCRMGGASQTGSPCSSRARATEAGEARLPFPNPQRVAGAYHWPESRAAIYQHVGHFFPPRSVSDSRPASPPRDAQRRAAACRRRQTHIAPPPAWVLLALPRANV